MVAQAKVHTVTTPPPPSTHTHTRARARAQVKRDIIIESSEMHPYDWHLNTRAGQTDWGATDSRAFMDYTKSDMERATRAELAPCDMGWWGFELYNAVRRCQFLVFFGVCGVCVCRVMCGGVGVIVS